MAQRDDHPKTIRGEHFPMGQGGGRGPPATRAASHSFKSRFGDDTSRMPRLTPPTLSRHYLRRMLMKDTAPTTGGADESGMDGTAAGIAEPLHDLEEPHGGGLDLYDIDAEY